MQSQSLLAHAPPTEVTPLLPYTNQPANHPQALLEAPITVHTLALSKLKRGGRRRCTPPTTTTTTITITGNTSTHPHSNHKNLDSSLYPTPLPDTKTTLPLLIIGDCRLVQQHPLSLPTRGFCNNGGLDLSGLGVLALRHPTTPLIRRDAVGLRRAATPHLAR